MVTALPLPHSGSPHLSRDQWVERPPRNAAASIPYGLIGRLSPDREQIPTTNKHSPNIFLQNSPYPLDKSPELWYIKGET